MRKQSCVVAHPVGWGETLQNHRSSSFHVRSDVFPEVGPRLLILFLLHTCLGFLNCYCSSSVVKSDFKIDPVIQILWEELVVSALGP